MARDPYAGLDPGFASALRQLIADAPGKITITSGFRSRAEQEALYKKKPKLAAKPGHSKHEKGMAADLDYHEDPEVEAWVHRNAYRYGLRFPMLTKKPGKKYEPWHVEPIGSAAHGAAQHQPAGGEAHAHDGGDDMDPDPYDDDPRDMETQTSLFLGVLGDPMSDLLGGVAISGGPFDAAGGQPKQQPAGDPILEAV